MSQYPDYTNKAFAELNRKRDASAKKRAEQLAAKEPLLEKAKEAFKRDLARAKALQGPSREMAVAAVESKFAKKVEEITGVAEARRAADERYHKQFGHPPGPEYTRSYDPVARGGLGSAEQGIRQVVAGMASEAAQMAAETAMESSAPAPAFNYDFRSGPSYSRKASVAGKTVEHKNFSVYEVKVVNEAKGQLETLFSVTGNVDRGQDRIEPGAFESVIREIKSGAKPWPALLYGHQMDSLAAVMGSITDLVELRPGSPQLPQRLQANGWGAVKAMARFNLKTSAGRDGFELARAGDLPSWSFAYVPGEFEFQGKGDDAIRSLRTIEELLECSLVVVPMNPEARTLTVSAGLKSAGISDLRVDRIEAAVLQKLATVFAGWKLTRP